MNRVKPSVKMCRVCLSDNVINEAIDIRLLDFYNEITDVNVFAHPMLSFCPLCEYKLRKFYNFKQRCLRSNFILKKEITNPGPINLKSMQRLISREVGISVPGDRRGFYEFKYPSFIAEQNPENKTVYTTQTDINELNDVKTEEMISSDEIKTEVFDDPLSVDQNDFTFDLMEVDQFEDTESVNDPIEGIETDANEDKFEDTESVNDPIEGIETDANDRALKNDARNGNAVENDTIKDKAIYEDGINAIKGIEKDTTNDRAIKKYKKLLNDEKIKSDAVENDIESESIENDTQDSDNEMLTKKKNKTTKVSNKTNKIHKTKTEKQGISQYTETDRFTPEQLDALSKETLTLNDFDLTQLKIIKKCLSKEQKKQLNFQLDVEKLKEYCLELLDEERVDLGEVKMTKEMFLDMFAKCDISNIKTLGVVTQMNNLSKIEKFLLYLHKKYSPEYETVFEIDYLCTKEEKIQEFNSRKNNKQYIEAPYKCEECYLPFTYLQKLEYHKKGHVVTPNDIVCVICPLRFATKRRYYSHRKECHSAVYRCKLCHVVTYRHSVMLNHYNQHKGVEHHCPICLSVYNNKTTFESHYRSAHATHVCNFCSRRFVSENGLQFHKKIKHKDEVAANPAEATLCTECNITFDSHAVYLRHSRSAHTRLRETVYRCYFCKDGFDSIEALRKHKLELNHQRAPKKVTEVPRTSIGAKTNTEKGTKRTRVNDPDEPYRKCPVCQVEVPNTFRTSMYKHYKKDHPDVPYKSLFTDSKNYLCEHCGKTFRVYCHYLDHKNQHTGLKPYACKECPAQFTTRIHLFVHSERHRPRRHECKDCGKMFRTAANLYTHSKIHIGDRRYKCNICFKGFLHPAALKNHIAGVHNHVRRKRKQPSKVRKEL